MTLNSLLIYRRIPNKLTIVGNINQKILQKIFFKMQIDLDKIKKLPADVRKDFMKMAVKLDEKKKISKVKEDFLSFAKHMWPEFIEGRHHKIIGDKFNKMAQGKIKRLIVNMPPRHTKSEFASSLL
jgi:hypothetical protein